MSDVYIYVVATILLFLSGAFSGLNIGMMMTRPEELRRKAAHGDKIAERVYRYRKDGYYLIFCILLGNVGVNTSLSIILGDLTTGIIGGLVATALITTFGEILPQAIFSQRGYKFARHFFWLLDVIYVVFWPLALPVSKLLSRWLGKEPTHLYTHEELEKLVHDHAQHDGSKIDHLESHLVSGVLRFSRKSVEDIMTPIDKVFSIELKRKLSANALAQLKRKAYSRIPVRSEGRFVGLLYMKDLVGREPGTPVTRVYRDKIHDIDATTPLDTALNRFIQTRSHIFVVYGEAGEEVGIVTLEDVIEEMINREIEDEYDGVYH